MKNPEKNKKKNSYVSDPAIIALWEKFGEGMLVDVHIDNENFFGKKIEYLTYNKERFQDKILSARNVRTVIMGFSRLHPIAVNVFMKIWSDKTSNYIANVSIRAFLNSQEVLSLFPGNYLNNYLSCFGTSIKKSRSGFKIKKFNLADLTVKEAWTFFAQNDKLLVIQNLNNVDNNFPDKINHPENRKLYITNHPDFDNFALEHNLNELSKTKKLEIIIVSKNSSKIIDRFYIRNGLRQYPKRELKIEKSKDSAVISVI